MDPESHDSLDTLQESSPIPIDEAGEFYAFTLTADEAGQIFVDCQTHWVGWADERCRVEIRQARLVNWRMGRLWENQGLPFMIVATSEDLLMFLLQGGNALVERSVAEAGIADLLTPQPSYSIGLRGFVSPGLVEPNAAVRRAPSPKLRMKVLKRDGRRCRICGRNPDDNVDLVLHVHHIRPWEMRGLTDPSNLITLCHTCHSGLEPHFDPSLFTYLEPKVQDGRLARLNQGIANYRRASALDYDELA